ncbi:MAG TPA: hypothetical protein VKS21_01450 [Spirochaetota bacterium]|nr:hypothetical protein [Spirochaetota bacterium]
MGNRNITLFSAVKFIIITGLFYSSGLLKGYEIKSYISAEEILINETVRYAVVVTYSTNQHITVKFPEEVKFRQFKLRKGYYHSGQELVDNKLAVTESYTYILRPRVSGMLIIPQLDLTIISNKKPLTVSTLEKVVLVKEPASCALLQYIIAGVLLFIVVTIIVVRVYALYKKKAARQKRKAVAKLAREYRERISKGENVKFAQDKRNYLMFLIDHFKMFYKNFSSLSYDCELEKVYQDLLKKEQYFKFSNQLDRDIVANWIKNLEWLLKHKDYGGKNGS